MCCNTDSESPFFGHPPRSLLRSTSPVLFSVLVLHWITSKDNASTVSSQNGEQIRSIQPTPSPKRLVPRPPLSEIAAYELGLREWRKATGVTTVVSAKEPDDELALDRISTIPPNVVTIETAHIREVSHVRPDRRSIRTVSDEQQSGKTGSTDDLCRRNNSQ
jgi:hypothetical protein